MTWKQLPEYGSPIREVFVWGCLECSPYSRPRVGLDDVYRAIWDGDGWLLTGPQVDGGTWVCGVQWFMELPEEPGL